MKKTAFAAFVAFWSSVGTLIIASMMLPSMAQESDTVYRLEQVAEHNQADDCWMVIEGQVYDLTDYLPMHPAPPAVITSWCGREATEGMRTKGYGRDHSEAAWGLLEPYRIGQLAEE